jgi:hypothetical protein
MKRRQSSTAAKLGVLQLAHKPLRLRGTLGHPDTFPFPTVNRQVPGAWTKVVMEANAALERAYVAEAVRLESEGVRAIMANCGFAIVYQDAIRNAVSLPVISSSLLQLPFLLRVLPAQQKVGVLTFDADTLTDRHFRAAGVTELSRVVIAGIEGSPSYQRLNDPEPDLSLDRLQRDVLDCARRLLAEHDDVGGLLLECSAFCPFAQSLRHTTGLIVMDFVTLGNFVMAALGADTTHDSP